MEYVKVDVRRSQIVQSARTVMMRAGVGGLTMRGVAAEAGIALGTLHYAFPSKELLLKSVIEDVADEIAVVLHQSIDLDGGLEASISTGIRNFWSALVMSETNLQLMQYELSIYAMRTPGLQQIAKDQYEKYCDVVAQWCQSAADAAGESYPIDFAELARMIVAGVDGLILQYLSSANIERTTADVEILSVMICGLVRGDRAVV